MAHRPTVLVTGGSGLIGRQVLETLAASECPLVLTYRPGGTPLPATVSCHGAVRVPNWTPAGLREALKDHAFERVIHLAAYGVNPLDRDPGLMYRVNVDCTLALADLASERGVESFVHAGSSAEYAADRSGRALREDGALQSEQLYGSSKAAAGLLLSALARHRALPSAVLRIFGVFGPNEAAHRLLPSLVRQLKRGERVPLSAGTQIRDFSYVKDVAHDIVRVSESLAQNRVTGGIYNVSSGLGTSVREFAELVCDSLGQSRDLLGFGDIEARPDDLAYVVGDNTLFTETFGARARRSLSETILESAEQLARRADAVTCT